jgi:hypothetical protein
MGSLVAAIAFFMPVYFSMKKFVVAYRTHVHSKVERWKIYTIISKSALLRWYTKVRDLGGLS